MIDALLVNFESFVLTTKNKIFRLVKLLADLSTRLKAKIIPALKKRPNSIPIIPYYNINIPKRLNTIVFFLHR